MIEQAKALSIKLHELGTERARDDLIFMARDALESTGLPVSEFAIERTLKVWCSQSKSLAERWRIKAEVDA